MAKIKGEQGHRFIKELRGAVCRERIRFRNIPREGKLAIRHCIQNYVVLTFPSLYCDRNLEIYQMDRDSSFTDRTDDIEDRT